MGIMKLVLVTVRFLATSALVEYSKRHMSINVDQVGSLPLSLASEEYLSYVYSPLFSTTAGLLLKLF
jgi:hypothetical protein